MHTTAQECELTFLIKTILAIVILFKLNITGVSSPLLPFLLLSSSSPLSSFFLPPLLLIIIFSSLFIPLLCFLFFLSLSPSGYKSLRKNSFVRDPAEGDSEEHRKGTIVWGHDDSKFEYILVGSEHGNGILYFVLCYVILFYYKIVK
jgi:hypothetical protein